MPPPTTSSAELTHQEWVDRNPLRAWRLNNQPKKIAILKAAAMIGVGTSMIQMYERGVHKPGPDRDEALRKYLGDDWSKQWDAWRELPHSPI